MASIVRRSAASPPRRTTHVRPHSCGKAAPGATALCHDSDRQDRRRWMQVWGILRPHALMCPEQPPYKCTQTAMGAPGEGARTLLWPHSATHENITLVHVTRHAAGSRLDVVHARLRQSLVFCAYTTQAAAYESQQLIHAQGDHAERSLPEWGCLGLPMWSATAAQV